MIVVANLDLLSTTPEGRQIMGTISESTSDILRWAWRKKFKGMLTLLLKFINNDNFSDWWFFHLPQVSMTPLAHLWISSRISVFRKKLKWPQWYTQELLRNWFTGIILNLKISRHCPFKKILFYTFTFIFDNCMALFEILSSDNSTSLKYCNYNFPAPIHILWRVL